MNRVKTLEGQIKPSPSEICVLGACFLDYVGYVDRMPKPGETIHSKSYAKGFGGKGANQAVMAGRLGGSVRMVSVVGRDGDGAAYVDQLKTNNVNSEYVFPVEKEATGLAMIFVDQGTAQNEIVICPNATHALTPTFLMERTNGYRSFLDGCKIIVLQNEIPLATTLDVMKAAHSNGIYTIFNCAPAPSREEAKIIQPYLQYCSLFCPNETEASLLTDVQVVDRKTAEAAILVLQKKFGVKDVVVTLGAQGFVLSVAGSAAVHVDGLRVKAVDSTGAGDCFVGSMTYFLQKGDSLLDACKKANICASISVQRKGTQSSFPYPHELPPALTK